MTRSLGDFTQALGKICKLSIIIRERDFYPLSQNTK